jgi:hypothetical protein
MVGSSSSAVSVSEMTLMEQTPNFDEAVQRLKRFLADQGWPTDLAWRFERDIVPGSRCGVVVRRRSEARAALAVRAHYETGCRSGVGIAMEVACDLEGVACTTVYWTTNATEAAYRMMPERGLKLSVATPHRHGHSVGILRWWWAKRKARSWTALVSSVAAQQGIAPDDRSPSASARR